MANTKEYTIKINGLQESINAVDSLNKQLDKLEQRMKTINATKTSSGGGSSSSRANTALSEEERVQKEINKLKEQGAQLDAKIAASQDEIYKRVDATKQLYKETIADQKAIAAQERLTANAYSNTMVGMKQQLADIKAVIQTTDLSDNDGIKKMTEQANELTKKLKEMEEAYGQFGRNVGNYQSAVEGLNKYKVTIGGVTREFDNAKQAAKTLSNELLNMPKGAAGSEEVHAALLKIKSDIADLQKSSSVMDNMLDTMESFAAIANAGQGIRGLFGVDDAEMQKSIKNLVALQNILKGIETINKQMKTGEGIGGWMKPFNTQIDATIAKLVTLQTTMKTTTVASKAMAVGIKAATLALKAFKAALSLGISIAIDLVLEKVLDLIEKFKESDKELEKQKKYIEETQGAYAKAAAEISVYTRKVSEFNGTQKQENKLVEELNSKFGKQLGTYKTLAEWKKVLQERGEAYAKTMLKEAEAQALLNMYTEAFINLQKVQANVAAGEYHHWYQTVAGDREADAKAVADANKKLTEAEEAYQKKMKEIDDFNKENKLMDYAPQIEKNGKKNVDAVKEAEKELIAARIGAMKEGLNKTIKQLEEERKKRIEKLRANGKKYGELEKQWNEFYDQQILDAKEKWAKSLEKLYEDLWDKIYSDSLENTKRIAALMSSSIENGRENMNNGYNKIMNQSIGSYGIQGRNQLSPATQFSLGLNSVNNSQFMKDMKQEISLMREAQAAENEYMAALRRFEREKDTMSNADLGRMNFELDHLENNFNERKRILEEYRNEMSKLYDPEQMEGAKTALFNETYSEDLPTLFKQRMSAVEAYWQERISFETSAATANYQSQMAVLKEQYEADKRAELRHWNEMQQLASDAYKKEEEGIRTQEENKLITHEEAEAQLREVEAKYNKEATLIFNNHNIQMEAMEKQFNVDMVKLNNDREKQIKKVNSEAYQDRLQELRDFQTAISNLESKQPVMNDFGFTNLSATYKNNKELLSSYQSMANKIISLRSDINKQYADGIIDKDVYESTIRELDSFSADLGEKMDKVKQEMSLTAQVQVLVGEISQYAQQLGAGLNNMLQAFADYVDQQYENTINELEDEIDKQKELYDKQEELANEHKNKLNEIEDELATARGDRRQRLIDELNAEMAAQRKALQEQQKAEKEQKRLEQQKDREEKKRKEDQKKMAMTQAVINGATAFMNALSQQPIWLGIALAAMTAVMTAAQIATISSAKYADGGVIQGKSHAQGGIKVLGGAAEVEGGEYITNKRTTAQNIDLLEYINSRKKKIDLSDLVEFYSSGKTIKNISPTKRIFADGGQIPTLRGDIDINSRLLTAFEDYSNRPVQVAVVDINERQAAVKNVQVMAGLEQ